MTTPSHPNLLVFDIGNTNIVVGVFDETQLVAHWRIATVKSRTADEYAVLLKNLLELRGLSLTQLSDIIISTVVPPMLPYVQAMCHRYINVEPLIVGPGIKTGMPVLYENPREVGADRIVNAVAAYHLYGGPIIIVDFGTATTFCSISAKGEYMGGVITPGVTISSEALFQKAAKLPRVEILEPPCVIGRNTVVSMQSGIYFGYRGLVTGILEKMFEELGHRPTVVATGGLAELIMKDLDVIDHIEPHLTLQGLRLIYLRNKKK